MNAQVKSIFLPWAARTSVIWPCLPSSLEGLGALTSDLILCQLPLGQHPSHICLLALP